MRPIRSEHTANRALSEGAQVPTYHALQRAVMRREVKEERVSAVVWWVVGSLLLPALFVACTGGI